MRSLLRIFLILQLFDIAVQHRTRPQSAMNDLRSFEATVCCRRVGNIHARFPLFFVSSASACGAAASPWGAERRFCSLWTSCTDVFHNSAVWEDSAQVAAKTWIRTLPSAPLSPMHLPTLEVAERRRPVHALKKQNV